MEKTLVVSFRLPYSLIKEFVAFCITLKFWKPNTIFVRLLKNLLANASYDDLQKVVRWNKWSGRKLKITVEEI